MNPIEPVFPCPSIPCPPPTRIFPADTEGNRPFVKYRNRIEYVRFFCFLSLSYWYPSRLSYIPRTVDDILQVGVSTDGVYECGMFTVTGRHGHNPRKERNGENKTGVD